MASPSTRRPGPGVVGQPPLEPLEHEPPHQRGHDRGDGPGNQDREPHQGAAAEGPVHGERQGAAHHQLETHARGGEPCRVGHRVPEPPVPEHLDVVVHPDERSPQPRHPKVVKVERLPDRPAQRKQGDEQDGEHRRRRHPPGQPGFTPLGAVRLSGRQRRLFRVRPDRATPASPPRRVRVRPAARPGG